MEKRSKLAPCVCFSHDEGQGRLKIEVQLPGVDKKDIALDMRKDSFCVAASRGDTEYSGCYTLSHEVEPEKTEAKYENGLLRIFSPIKDWEKRFHVTVQ